MKIFKSLYSNLAKKVMTVDDVDILWKACQNGDLDTVDNILKTKKIVLFQFPINEIFNDTCRGGKSEIVKYLLTSPNAKMFHNAHLKDDKWITSICHRQNLSLLKYLLTSPDLKEHPNLTNDTKAMKAAFDAESIDIAKFLVLAPELKHKVNPHVNEDEPFKMAFFHKDEELLKGLIFDLGIEKTPTIEKFIASHKSMGDYNRPDPWGRKKSETIELIENMFSIRELNETLQSELNCDKIHKTNSRKHKI